MHWVIFFMKYNNEPLMFINTVNTKNKLNGQTVYDSRKETKSIEEEIGFKKENETLNLDILSKLENMVKQYDENIVIICKIKLTNETIICIPMAIKEGRLLARKIDSEQINIDLNQIIAVEKIRV